MEDAFRILLIVMLPMHGLVHLIWTASAWTSIRTGFGDGTWSLPGDITIRSPIGKAWGVAGVVVLLLFLAGSLGLLVGASGWISPTNLGVFLSLGVVAPWRRQAPGSTVVTAIIVDIVLMFVLALELV